MRNVARVTATVALAAAFVLPGCTRSDKGLQVTGSDTMVKLGAAWAEAFSEATGKAVSVRGGGSGTGIAAIIDGNCDVAQASRAMKAAEIQDAEANGHKVHETQVGIDCIVVAVHPDNPVKSLTLEQLSGIYSFQITNWKQVGGADAKITVTSRDRSSGTHVYFLEEVVRLGKSDSKLEFHPKVAMLASSQAVVAEVRDNVHAIGYYGLGYLTAENRGLAVAAGKSAPVLPSVEAAIDGSYPISRPLFLYSLGTPEGTVKAFLDFCLSPEGQEIVAKEGFVPLPKIVASAK